jgi:bacterioferritin-associated ferredoxin
MQANQDNDIICHCSGTTEIKIKELLACGSNDLDILSKKTGACSGCGSCEDAILQLIAEQNCL